MDTRLLYLSAKNTVTGTPLARVHVTSPQLIATNTSGTITPTWNATDYSINGATVGSTYITVPNKGYYLVQSLITFSSSTSSTYSGPTSSSFGRVDITVNGTVVSSGTAIAQSTSSSIYTSLSSDIVYATQGSSISVKVYGLSSSSIYVWAAGTGDTVSSYLSLSFVAA